MQDLEELKNSALKELSDGEMLDLIWQLIARCESAEKDFKSERRVSCSMASDIGNIVFLCGGDENSLAVGIVKDVILERNNALAELKELREQNKLNFGWVPTEELAVYDKDYLLGLVRKDEAQSRDSADPLDEDKLFAKWSWTLDESSDEFNNPGCAAKAAWMARAKLSPQSNANGHNFQKALGCLADIVNRDDMDLQHVKRKARRVYDEIEPDNEANAHIESARSDREKIISDLCDGTDTAFLRGVNAGLDHKGITLRQWFEAGQQSTVIDDGDSSLKKVIGVKVDLCRFVGSNNEYEGGDPVHDLISSALASMTYLIDRLRTIEQSPAVAVPDGWKLVPLEATPDMMIAGGNVNSEWLNDNAPIGVERYVMPMQQAYAAMLSAAPQASAEQDFPSTKEAIEIIRSAQASAEQKMDVAFPVECTCSLPAGNWEPCPFHGIRAINLPAQDEGKV